MSPRQRRTLLVLAAAVPITLLAGVSVAGHVSADTNPAPATGQPAGAATVSVFGPKAKPLDHVPADQPARGLVYHGLVAARTGSCVGGYQVVGITRVMCTHGPDAPRAGVDVKVSVKPLATASAAAAASTGLAVC